MKVVHDDGAVTLWLGDCVEVMRGMADGSVDAVVCDPPYGLEFMGKEWDRIGSVGEWEHAITRTGYKDGSAPLPRPNYGSTRNPVCRACHKHRRGTDHCRCAAPDYDQTAATDGQRQQAWHEQWAREAIRVARSGAFLLAAGGDRTHHRLACALEDAGWEIRTTICHLFGSGFPKSLSVSGALEPLPWCPCGRSEETRPAAKPASRVNEKTPAADAFACVSGGGVQLHLLDPAGIPAQPPLERVCTGIGTAGIVLPPDGASADAAGGLADKPCRSARHRGPAMDVGIEKRVGDAEPIVLRPANVAVVAERDQSVDAVGVVKPQPESLGNEVMGEQSIGCATVGALPVARDSERGDVFPRAPLVGPFATAPCGVSGTGHAAAVGGLHAGALAVDGHGAPGHMSAKRLSAATAQMEGRASLETRVVAPTHRLEIDAGEASLGAIPRGFSALVGTPTNLAGFGEHSDLIQNRISRGEIQVCASCSRPIFPAWLNGFGTALKPAAEFWTLARKPLSGTVVANVLAHGTGALNIDATRVAGAAWTKQDRDSGAGFKTGKFMGAVGRGEPTQPGGLRESSVGRWPSNVILQHVAADPLTGSPGCERVGTKRVVGSHPVTPGGGLCQTTYKYAGSTVPIGAGNYADGRAPHDHTDADGLETVEAWRCVEGCPVAELDRQSGDLHIAGNKTLSVPSPAGATSQVPNTSRGPTSTYSDTGTASRFFPQFQAGPDDAPFRYVAKAARAEREEGCAHLPARRGAEAVDREEGSAGVESPRAGAGRTGGKIIRVRYRLRPDLTPEQLAYVQEELAKAGVSV